MRFCSFRLAIALIGVLLMVEVVSVQPLLATSFGMRLQGEQEQEEVADESFQGAEDDGDLAVGSFTSQESRPPHPTAEVKSIISSIYWTKDRTTSSPGSVWTLHIAPDPGREDSGDKYPRKFRRPCSAMIYQEIPTRHAELFWDVTERLFKIYPADSHHFVGVGPQSTPITAMITARLGDKKAVSNVPLECFFCRRGGADANEENIRRNRIYDALIRPLAQLGKKIVFVDFESPEKSGAIENGVNEYLRQANMRVVEVIFPQCSDRLDSWPNAESSCDGAAERSWRAPCLPLVDYVRSSEYQDVSLGSSNSYKHGVNSAYSDLIGAFEKYVGYLNDSKGEECPSLFF